jgi:hypothetical protein
MLLILIIYISSEILMAVGKGNEKDNESVDSVGVGTIGQKIAL